MSEVEKVQKKKKLIRPRGKRGGIKHSKRKTPSHKHAVAIAKYHALEKKIARCTDEAERATLLAEQQESGGLSNYQDQSTTGGSVIRGGESAKWCAQVLKEILSPDTKIRLLDVGGIAGTAYEKYKWIEATYVDLNPRAPHVHQSDFFDWPVPSAAERYDVVGLSLVLNFVGDLAKRGEMLLHAHQYLRPRGYVYLVLPLACVNNSRYMTHDHLRAIIESAGYDVVRQDDSARLTRWLIQQRKPKRTKSGDSPLDTVRRKYYDGTVFKKQELVAGAQRNNFCIRLS
ncbi:25S rRNA (adenine(2142)-N(1))-methyltransferase [Malassezia psittaci]|uniref:25S rRNA adenine-N(1) methyltransferase n=1 Tax=Malassezia psittaci TaxID=1821823 RepID=A0AAF0FE24_9BASI|nr:25S rRNA (adenine(2142)-N(1))-methyltransferase [Malassezia psittaci]